MEILEEHILHCGDCNKPLLNVVVTETNDTRISKGCPTRTTIIRIKKCSYCGGSSFDSPPFAGSINIKPAQDDISLESIETIEDTKTGVLTNILTMGKY